ncbi:hypothetical protein TanjilG_27160 [Lupinus angustifolius]|uniref:HMA domain-containing protein n=1 Tax=Lupinus angustifolius TaxID=3871 RepID=A0A4P1QW22_LUPAN|nr:PREDICTED: pollen-specific leucine-rich repeat extensin-like protein 1 [Lupinus angustifolius]OIV96056.1 hypothetical protein TanjilG_27160 [Lupinus angustifolius]
MAGKVTIMKLKVDLECEKCCKKVKKLLTKYTQIRDQTFDEKQNIVTITVVCCSPEKIRDKLCCKGGGSIKSIEIVEPPKAKPPEPEKKKEKKEVKFVEPEKKKEDEKPKPKSNEPEKKREHEKKKEAEKPKSDNPKKDAEKPKEKPTEPKPMPDPAPVTKILDPVHAHPQVPPPMAVPVGMFCVPAYESRPVGPYVNECGGPPLCYDGYYGRPVYDGYGGRPYYTSRCDQYFSEENAEGCTIM